MRTAWHGTARLVCLVCLLWLGCTAGRASLPPSGPAAIAGLQRDLEQLLQHPLARQAHIGLKVVSLRSGEVLFEHDAEKLFHPASNTKLFTAVTALAKLGVTYRYPTVIAADTTLTDTLRGNLFIKGYGDPDLTTADLETMARTLYQKGLRVITGDLIADDHFFDDLRLGPGWMWDDGPYRFWPPISALTVNRNCVTVVVEPGPGLGDTVRAWVEPNTAYVPLRIKATTAAPGAAQTLRVDRNWRQGDNTIRVEGLLPLDREPVVSVRTIEEPALYAGHLLAEALRREGVLLVGKVRLGHTPKEVWTLTVHRSAPLSRLVEKLLKPSDNLFAEQILKTLGAMFVGEPGSSAKGTQVVKAFLAQEVGLQPDQYALADGSGVSRYNLFSASQLSRLLTQAFYHFGFLPEFLQALPIAGVDGTLQNRMLAAPVRGNVRAKTGSLVGVSTLSGYVNTRDNETLAVSILISHFVGSSAPAHQWQDSIFMRLARFSRKGARPSLVMRP